MKGATTIGAYLMKAAHVTVDKTTDGQAFLEVELDVDGTIAQHIERARRLAKLPTYRAWFPLSPKSIAELAVMGLHYSRDGAPLNIRNRDPSIPTFLIDLVSVECSDEEAHGEEARRFFVRNPRKEA